MKHCKIIALANQKGGTGKTTSAINLGHALAAQGKKILLVDFDPQANLTMSCGVDSPDELEYTMYHMLMEIIDTCMAPAKEKCVLCGEKLDCIPSSVKLAVAEGQLLLNPGNDDCLELLLESLREDYDYILIDTNPSIGKLAVTALCACDSVIIPVSPQLWSASGLKDLVSSILRIKRRMNPNISIDGVLFTICDERTIICKGAIQWIQQQFSAIPMFHTQIPATTIVSRSNYASQSILDYHPTCKAAQAYRQLAAEVMELG